MKALGITTSTARGSVALVDDDRRLGRISYEGEMHHAERIFGALDELLDATGVPRGQIEVVACDVGPGSFTGVRAGLAAAKGIALTLAVPLVGVGSLEAMAAAAWADLACTDATHVASLLDAKRRETFYALYDRTGRAVAGPRHVPSDRVIEALGPLASNRSVRFAGAQARRLGLARERTLLSSACRLPDAAWIARRSARALASGAPSRLADVQAVYLRAPDAVPMVRPHSTRR